VTQNVAYIPYGEVFVEQRNGTWNTPYLFNAKELDEETGLYYYGARYLDPTGTRWLSVDPLFEKYVGMTPYGYCMGNPVGLVDVDGRRPIYDEDGNFLGTDETGLQGNPIVMWKDKFVQGMSETEANQNDLGLEFLSLQTGYTGDDGKDPYERFLENYTNLSSRPDWDGFVSVDEGVQWAKEHPGALNNPTSENTLYINAAMLDFGPLSTNHFAEENVVTPVNLFPINTAGDFWEAFKSRMSEKRYGTVYALGRCNMILRNRNARTVTIVNDEATDYDWNGGGAGYRNDFIEWERKRKGLDDRHGFKVFYYGVGVLNK
ncbi:MAG: RHS repeat-associated core domain-containing protein, partial [Bacteroidales bacterium]|nr:RHS repeat-associated core domain-containing protein [Bacteroidales bacterium]